MLLGEEAMNRLEASRVAVFGVGGVGGFVVEALARSGVGTIDIIDNDTVVLSNLNRQILALDSTVGLPKTAAAAERIRQIYGDKAAGGLRVPASSAEEPGRELIFTLGPKKSAVFRLE